MSKVLSYVAPQYTATVSVTSGQGVSTTVDLGPNTLVGMFLSTSLTSTTVTFQVSTSLAGTYVNVIDGAGNTLSKTVTGGTYLYLDPNVFSGMRYLQLTFGSNEGATRIITLATRSIT